MIKVWVKRRITELMGEEDEIVINLAISQLEDATSNIGMNGIPDKRLDPKLMQVHLTGKC